MSEEIVRRILIIDDNRAIHEDFRRILAEEERNETLDDLEASLFGEAPTPAPTTQRKYIIHSAYQGQEGYELVRRSLALNEPYPLAFVDMRMPPGWDGVKTIEMLWQLDPDLQIVICTAYSDYSWEEISQKFGAADRLLILRKPFDTAEVCQLACALTEKWHLAKHAHLKLNQLRAMVDEQTRELAEANRRLREEVEQRRRSEDRYSMAAAGANDGLWDWDMVSGSMFCSRRFKEMFGLEDVEVGLAPEEWLSRIHPDDQADFEHAWKSHLKKLTPQLTTEFRALHRDGQYRWFLCRGLAVHDEEGKAKRAAGSLTNITDRKMAEEQLRFEALHDTLTGLANRTLLYERIKLAVDRAKRNRERTFAVLFLDLDHFKIINDSLGHGVGDQLLVEVAQRLVASARKVDAVARMTKDHVARIGGDEFVVLIEELHDPADALRVAERIHDALEAPIRVGGHEIRTFASIGVVLGEERYERPEEILRDADTALYQAKEAGKACTRIFDPEMHAQAVIRWQTESDLRRAIDTNQICAFYQPILGRNGELVAWEALVRWRHPQRGLVPPMQFIPICEETGLIIPLGRQILEIACRQLATWKNAFPGLPDLAMSVNVSTRQFGGPNLSEEVNRVLEDTGVAPRDLRLEITESAAMRDASLSFKTLAELRDRGVLIYIDDFGTGYSSLSQIHTMPIDALKIDRAFVDAMERDKVSRSIIDAVVALAHGMNLRVIAEGVETASQLDILRRIGVDHLQGYFFSKPMDAEAATAYLANAAKGPLLTPATGGSVSSATAPAAATGEPGPRLSH